MTGFDYTAIFALTGDRSSGLLHTRVYEIGGACPQRDSNPCRRLERAVSWAARRWGLTQLLNGREGGPAEYRAGEGFALCLGSVASWNGTGSTDGSTGISPRGTPTAPRTWPRCSVEDAVYSVGTVRRRVDGAGRGRPCAARVERSPEERTWSTPTRSSRWNSDARHGPLERGAARNEGRAARFGWDGVLLIAFHAGRAMPGTSRVAGSPGAAARLSRSPGRTSAPM